MDIINNLLKNAQAEPQRIVLPEGNEIRTIKAADKILADKAAEIILIGNESEIKSLAEQNNLKNVLAKAKIVDPETNEKMGAYAELLCELRKKKGMTLDEAKKISKDPLYLGCLMIKSGDADGELAGARSATANVLRPAFQIVKTAPGVTAVSGAFLMLMPNKSLGANGAFIFADCGSIPCATSEQLAQIAICSAESAKIIGNFEPNVAMLSFSTKGSAKNEVVDKVINATKMAQEMRPDLNIDGELQLDAAVVPEVAATKAPGSPVAGKANVLIFPSLDAGNIGYKLAQRFAGAVALGPILQGIASPVNDLSRGCSVEDVYKMMLVTSTQAIFYKKNK